MEPRISPVTGKPMKRESHPDITIDVCEDSGGIFLDKHELNILITGMQGDIEIVSVQDEEIKKHKDWHPIRKSRAHPDLDMQKVNLLYYSDIILDYCPKSEGFYLDLHELNRINAELKKYTANKESDELRNYVDGHLVRIEQFKGVESVGAGPAGIMTKAVNTVSHRILVFYENPLEIGLHVFEEMTRR